MANGKNLIFSERDAIMNKLLNIFLLLFCLTAPLQANAGTLTTADVQLVNGICVTKDTNQPVTGIVSVYNTDKYGHKYLEKKIEYRDGLKNYKCFTYTPTGTVEWEALFLNGNLDGQTKHHQGDRWIEYYNFTDNKLKGFAYQIGGSKGVLMLNDGHPYGWLNDKKLSSSDAQLEAEGALANSQKLQNQIFNF